VVAEPVRVAAELWADLVEVFGDGGKVWLAVGVGAEGASGPPHEVVEPVVVGRLFWVEGFHEGVGFDTVAVVGQIGDEFEAFGLGEAFGQAFDSEGAQRSDLGRRLVGWERRFGVNIGFIAVGVLFVRLGVVGWLEGRRWFAGEGLRYPVDMLGGASEVGDICLLGGCEVASLVGVAKRVDVDGAVGEVETPPVAGWVADDSADSSASVSSGEQPVRTFGAIRVGVEDDEGSPCVSSPWGESPFEGGDVLCCGGGVLLFDRGEDVGELVDHGDAFEVFEVVAESDTDDFEDVGDGTGGKLGGHRVAGGSHVAGLAGDLDSTEIFEVQEKLSVVVMADGDKGWVGGGGSVGEEVEVGDIDAGRECPAVSVVVDLPSGWRVVVRAPKQQPERVGAEMDTDHLGRWRVAVGDLVGEGTEGEVDELGDCGCGGGSECGLCSGGGGRRRYGDGARLPLS
jgi:hypothetical protein